MFVNKGDTTVTNIKHERWRVTCLSRAVALSLGEGF